MPLFVFGHATIDVWSGLCAPSVGVFTFPSPCRLFFVNPSPLCIPEMLQDIVSGLGRIVSLDVLTPADNVLRFVEGINVTGDRVDHILPSSFHVFDFVISRFPSVRLLFNISE